MTKITPEKDLRIETMRGLALFLMVAGHVIGSSSDLGMKVPDDSVLRYLYESSFTSACRCSPPSPATSMPCVR